MKNFPRYVISSMLILFVAFIAFNCSNSGDSKKKPEAIAVSDTSGPFQSHRDSVPSAAQYGNPLFTLSYNYPDTFTVITNPPWQQALKGQPIYANNALAYVDSLKSYVSPRIMNFFTAQQSWNAASNGWFHEPWTGSIREAILGTYVGSGFPAGTFTNLPDTMTTYVLTLYDSTAAYTLGKLWGKTGTPVNLLNNAGQFPEGSIVIKLAFTTANVNQWPSMKNAYTYQIYDTNTVNTGMATNPYQMRTVSLFQFDIIVKDTKTAPKTGWVFSTLVYDSTSTIGATAWDRMVPLGAMWGNDPTVNSTLNPTQPLLETVINPAAPPYSTETLGWGGRLSGPNDGAVIQYAVTATGQQYNNLAASSCMSCHSVAEDNFLSNLLPMPADQGNTDTATVFAPGGTQWLKWFQDNSGTVPFDSGQVALDFDMVTAFKSISLYPNNNSTAANKMLVAAAERFRKKKLKYNGRP